MRENERLSAKQQRAIDALLTEPTTRAAATAAGVSEATLWRWLADPAFSKAHRAARTQLLDKTLALLLAQGQGAIEALADVMKEATNPASARVSAARAILEISLKARDSLEMEERLKTIEDRLDALINKRTQ